MQGALALAWRPMTAADVLRVLVDDHRQQARHDPEADPDATLTLATTVAEWRAACDLVASHPLGRALNERFRVRIPDAQWDRLLEPSGALTLGPICARIADHALAPVPRPLRVLGRPCAEAGAFFAVRRILERAGVDTSRVGPRTPLHEYTRRHAGVFLAEVSRLAPGSLPVLEVVAPVAAWSLRALALAPLGGVLASALGSPGLRDLALAVGAGAWIALWIPGLPRRATLGSLTTFGDLARALAPHMSRR